MASLSLSSLDTRDSSPIRSDTDYSRPYSMVTVLSINCKSLIDSSSRSITTCAHENEHNRNTKPNAKRRNASIFREHDTHTIMIHETACQTLACPDRHRLRLSPQMPMHSKRETSHKTDQMTESSRTATMAQPMQAESPDHARSLCASSRPVYTVHAQRNTHSWHPKLLDKISRPLVGPDWFNRATAPRWKPS